MGGRGGGGGDEGFEEVGRGEEGSELVFAVGVGVSKGVAGWIGLWWRWQAREGRAIW